MYSPGQRKNTRFQIIQEKQIAIEQKNNCQS